MWIRIGQSDIEMAVGYAGAKLVLDNTGIPAFILLGDVVQDELGVILDVAVV